jgi:hypothetical protein
MSYRYSPLEKRLKQIYRKFYPIPKSPWTAGKIDDICEYCKRDVDTTRAVYKRIVYNEGILFNSI